MKTSIRIVRDPNRLANHEVATYALWCAGGINEPCDTEDVAALCWEIAPSRFSWKRYPQFPDKDIIRSALSDAKKKKYGELVQGKGEGGWLLTANGVRWVEENLSVLRQLDTAHTRSMLDREADQLLRHTRQHYLFLQWQADHTQPPEPYDIADLARLPADAPPSVVGERLSRLGNLAEVAGDDEMKEFLSWLRTGTSQ